MFIMKSTFLFKIFWLYTFFIIRINKGQNFFSHHVNKINQNILFRNKKILFNLFKSFSLHFLVLVFGHFWQRSYKYTKYYVIFVYILQGKMGKTEKNEKKIMQLKWSKYQKPKDEFMGWTKHKLRQSVVT